MLVDEVENSTVRFNDTRTKHGLPRREDDQSAFHKRLRRHIPVCSNGQPTTKCNFPEARALCAWVRNRCVSSRGYWLTWSRVTCLLSLRPAGFRRPRRVIRAGEPACWGDTVDDRRRRRPRWWWLRAVGLGFTTQYSHERTSVARRRWVGWMQTAAGWDVDPQTRMLRSIPGAAHTHVRKQSKTLGFAPTESTHSIVSKPES